MPVASGDRKGVGLFEVGCLWAGIRNGNFNASDKMWERSGSGRSGDECEKAII